MAGPPKGVPPPNLGDGADIFDIARSRGQRVRDLEELSTKEFNYNTGTKHNKKDYEILDKISFEDIMALSKIAKKQVKFRDDDIENQLVKVEKKKIPRVNREEQKKRDQEISIML